MSLGAFVANVFGGLGPIDMVGGALANFIATYLAWRVVKSKGNQWMLFGVGVEILVVTFVVGTYLSYLLAIPIQISWLGIFLGSVTAIGLLGSILLFALSRRRVAAVLEVHGFRGRGPSVKQESRYHLEETQVAND